MEFVSIKYRMPTAKEALLGRSESMPVVAEHYVTANTMQAPFPQGVQQAMFGMGCFWGVERKFWTLQGVFTTAVGYAAGFTPNPSYDEVCTGRTGHNEVVLVMFDPDKISYQQLLKVFWESHNPTQGMQQGNDRGTQYRSGIYTFDQQQRVQALESQVKVAQALTDAGMGKVTTEIMSAPVFYYAEDYHQQYLAKNPNGYCGLAGTGIVYHVTQ
jgi:peptide-methionine (S)-S-oxide reductase